MSNWIDSAVNEFCTAAGLDGMDFGQMGVLQMEFEHRGTLYIEKLEEELLLMLVKPINPYTALESMKTALACCDARQFSTIRLQVGLRNHQDLVFIARLDNNCVTRVLLEKTLDHLTQLQEQVA